MWPSAKYLPGGSASGLVGFSLSSFVPFFWPSSAIGLLPLAFLLLFPSVLGQDFLAFYCFCVSPIPFFGLGSALWGVVFGGFLPLFLGL